MDAAIQGLAGVLLLAAVAPTVAAAQTRSIWDGVYTEEQARRGEQAYLKGCTYCHGVDMRGGDDPPGPALKGAIFLARWKDRSVADLWALIGETMPRNNPGSVAPDTCVDIVSFLLKSNGLPAGMRELPPDFEQLMSVMMAEAPARRP